MYADNWKAYFNVIVEGGLYVISNFYTREATGTLKPTSSNIIINFSNSTHVHKLEEDDYMIPMHKFEFVDLSELFGIVSNYRDLVHPEFSTGYVFIMFMHQCQYFISIYLI